MSKAFYLVTFKDIGTGQIQILRTGSGFWRWDHGAPFSIDEALLATILRNTRLRARPLRVDVMHWSNGDMGEGLEDLVKAGEVDPASILMMPWQDPATGGEAWGLFCPVIWTHLGASAALDLDEISPVIEWEYVLPFDVLDEEGQTIPAGTCLGPTITGISLVDQGFFWMDKVRVYRNDARPLPSLFQERGTTMTPEQLAAFITWAMGEGWDEATINAMIAAATAKQEAAPSTPEMPDMAAGADPAQSAEVMAARAALTVACQSKNPATIMAAQKAYGAALAKVKKPAAPTTLAGLVASVAKKKAAATPTAAPAVTLAGQTAATIPADIQAQLNELKAGQDQILMKELEREGLLVGIDDPAGLYAEAPKYFMDRVQKNVALAGSAAPAGLAASPLRALKAVDAEDESEQHHKAINLYRETQKKAGRNLSYAQAMTEWEAANPGLTRKKKALL